MAKSMKAVRGVLLGAVLLAPCVGCVLARSRYGATHDPLALRSARLREINRGYAGSPLSYYPTAAGNMAGAALTGVAAAPILVATPFNAGATEDLYAEAAAMGAYAGGALLGSPFYLLARGVRAVRE
ncbi:MAG: hypothetical protein HY722_05200 [Planctomycetes bacterium]|nr:hypothetical protein [Planctomycetota bacterium]